MPVKICASLRYAAPARSSSRSRRARALRGVVVEEDDQIAEDVQRLVGAAGGVCCRPDLGQDLRRRRPRRAG